MGDDQDREPGLKSACLGWRRGGIAEACRLLQGLLFWLLKGGLKVSLGTVSWYRSSYGTDFDNSEIACPVLVSVDRVVHEREHLSRPGGKALRSYTPGGPSTQVQEYLPQTKITILNLEAVNTSCLGTLDI